MTATITLDVDPFIHLGPLTVAWHGLTIVLGLVAATWLAIRYARESGLDAEEIVNLAMITSLAGIIGAKAFYLIENDAGALLRPGEWLDGRGFSFYGAIIVGVPAVGLYLGRRRLGISYLDALAAGFPLGMAIGRVGDVINGEHYGPESDLPWAVRNAHPDADVPSNDVAYHSGGLYEVALALLMFAVIWPLRHRFRHPGLLLWTVIGLYALGRFAMFFARSDSDALALGLNGAQWTSLALLAVAVVGAARALRSPPRESRIGASSSDRL